MQHFLAWLPALLLGACSLAPAATEPEPVDPVTRPPASAWSPPLPDEEAWREGSGPAAYVLLHDVASSPGDPDWQLAVERLAELGDEYSLGVLRPLVPTLDERERAQLERALARIEERLAPKVPGVLAERVRGTFERVAWADLVCHPSEMALNRHREATLVEWARHEEVRTRLTDLEAHYEPAPGVVEELVLARGFERRVRHYAHAALETAQD